jgi:hypothetical protein
MLTDRSFVVYSDILLTRADSGRITHVQALVPSQSRRKNAGFSWPFANIRADVWDYRSNSVG